MGCAPAVPGATFMARACRTQYFARLKGVTVANPADVAVTLGTSLGPGCSALHCGSLTRTKGLGLPKYVTSPPGPLATAFPLGLFHSGLTTSGNDMPLTQFWPWVNP